MNLSAMFKTLRTALLPPQKGTVFNADETRAYCAANAERQTNPPNLRDQVELDAAFSAHCFRLARERADHPTPIAHGHYP